MSSLYAQGDAPLYFRMGEYNIKYNIDSLECFYFDKQWYGMLWMTTFVEESIILHPDHQYYYEKTESYNTFTSVIYSYGTWFYQDSIFYLNSEIDTLQLNETWRERQKIANNPVSFFEFSEKYKFLQMHDVKLYNHGNYAVSWSEDCQRELLRFDVTKKENFDDFLYLFINKPKFREMRMGVAHSACYVPINSENENDKNADAIITCPGGLEEMQRDTVFYKFKRFYKSLDESPYAFHKLPKGYSFSIEYDKTDRNATCNFYDKDKRLLFSLYFMRIYDKEWMLEYIIKNS